MIENTPGKSPEESGAVAPGSHNQPTVFEGEHAPRRADFDPRHAKKVERDIAFFFTLSAIMTVLFVVFYCIVGTEDVIRIPLLGTFSTSNVSLGVTFGLAILFIGIGIIQWAKVLMNGHEYTQSRHNLASPPESREEAIAAWDDGVEDSGFVTRKMARRSLLLSMSLFPIPLIVILRDLGPLPGDSLAVTSWVKGERIILDPTGTPIKPSDIPIGGIVSAMPASLPLQQEEEGNLNARAKDVVILIRLSPEQIIAEQGPEDDPWSFNGILCFSKICPHVGCPIALYEQRTHHLLCPCHQSTFDIANKANVIFGPAARNLPQLPITIDREGFLIAKDTFQVPIGPSYWERPAVG